MRPYIATPEDDAPRDEIGAKAAALAEAMHAGLPVPAWFAVTVRAAEACRHELSGEVLAAVQQAVAGLGEGPFAVRSSAAEEDAADRSFAGQFDSFLNVPAERVPAAVARVWASGQSERVRAYRGSAAGGLTDRGSADTRSRPPGVLVQLMVPAEAAGVAFSSEPVGGRRGVAVVSAVRGLADKLVAGEVNADTWRIDRAGNLLEPVGTPATGTPADEHLALTSEQARQVAQLARLCADLSARPQDVEWAFAAGRLWLLQSRPVTRLAAEADRDAPVTVWDNSNIAESYNGITTPLTFSFARRAYAGVYREFCRLMGVPAGDIAANDAMFGRMLGLVRGRVYYNLINWYRLLAMLPGFGLNRGFMEQMMGLRTPLPPEVVRRVLAERPRPGRLRDAARLARTCGGLVRNQLTLPRQVRRFYARLNAALQPTAVPLERLRPDELVDEFRRLEAALLRKWDAPIVNDFLAMIHFGLLGKLTTQWLGEAHEGLHNELVRDSGEIISAEPARRISEMAAVIATNVTLVSTLIDGTPRQAVRAARRDDALRTLFDAYIARFGDRCMEELKLESPTLMDDPTPLLRAVGHAARRQASTPATASRPEQAEPAARVAAAALAGRPIRRLVFGLVLRQARARVRDRENLRFERTRVFGRARRIFVELGRRLAAEGVLQAPRDVFWLEVDELLGYVDGTAGTTDLAALACLRRRQFEAYAADTPPADRFETHGPVHLYNAFEADAADTYEPPDGQTSRDTDLRGTDLRGTACCAGVVRGPVRVVTDPRGASLAPGEILVAERTDPGWIMLFPAAAGILVERGSLLSHSAIVAREMGIPAIVAIPDLTRRLQTGQWVEMDGATGRVRLLEAEAS